MFARLSVVAWALLAVTGVDANHHTINRENGNIPVDSDVGRHLMQHARKVAENNGQNQGDDIDYSFLSGYSVKFQGCHHVQQWNANAQDEDDVRIMTKRLVRFRLCPSNDCMSDLSGCTSKYGDYVVDMGTFVSSFMYSKQQGNQRNGGRELDFDVADYTYCSQLDMGRRLDQNQNRNQNQNQGQGQNGYYYEDDGNYYVGPYCADQGGEIHLGVFTDDTCTSFAQNGETKFYQAMGFALPYSSQSMVSLSCMNCGNGYNVNEFCSDIYTYAGKCETKMNVNYPNESSCSYIEGIKIIREDGVIRTSATKKSKAAAVCIGLFLTIAVLLAGYVYYLRTKLGRAKINLAAASQNLS